MEIHETSRALIAEEPARNQDDRGIRLFLRLRCDSSIPRPGGVSGGEQGGRWDHLDMNFEVTRR
jgi:hypothetical protein